MPLLNVTSIMFVGSQTVIIYDYPSFCDIEEYKNTYILYLITFLPLSQSSSYPGIKSVGAELFSQCQKHKPGDSSNRQPGTLKHSTLITSNC